MTRTTLLATLAIVLGSLDAPAQPAPAAGWEAVDRVFGQPGKDQPGGVHRFSWPRTDLRVSIAGIAVEPALALGSWGAFRQMPAGRGEVMGDLALLGPEVAPVLRALEKGGFEILAIHNHLIDETPRVVYVHFHGQGDPSTLAQTLKAALGRSATPLEPGIRSAAAGPSAEEEKTLLRVQELVGRKGNMAGRVLQLSIPRAEAISEAGMEVPPSMGMATAVNFQAVGSRVAVTGDFVLLADEVNAVIRELHSHGIDATALHSHMLRETPRLFFMHFWGVGTANEIAAGLKSALARIAVQPAAPK